MIKNSEKFYFIIILQVVFSSGLLSQLVKKSDNLIYSLETGDPYTGKAFELYEDGTKYCEGSYEDGLMNGFWSYYHPNGVLKTKGRFFHGNGENHHKVSGVPQNGREDNWFVYYSNGNLQAKYKYKNGEFDEERLEWYNNGNKKIKMYYMSGNPHGPRLEWYKNGQKKLVYFYSYGTKNGTWTAWYPDGTKKHLYSYVNGQKDQLWTVWWPNRRPKIKGSFIMGKKDGKFTIWFKDGEKKFELTFKDGKQIKKWTYNNDSNKHTKYSYINGKFEKLKRE